MGPEPLPALATPLVLFRSFQQCWSHHHCQTELEAARGVHFDTFSSARSLEDPGLVSMVKRTFPRIGTNEIYNFYQQPLQTFLKCYKDEQLICNRLAFEFRFTVHFHLAWWPRKCTEKVHTQHIVLVT